MGKETWSLFPSARGGLRRVREAVLVTRQKTPNASTATIAQQNVAKQKDRGTYHARSLRVPCSMVGCAVVALVGTK